MRCAARSRNCSISLSLALHKCRSWCRILHQNFVRTNGAHAVVNAIAAACSLAFYMVQSAGMHHGARRPRSAGVPDMVAIICAGSRESGQKRQTDSARATLSGTSSPVITHERVIGSLRSSMHKETITSKLRQLPSGSTVFCSRVGDGIGLL